MPPGVYFSGDFTLIAWLNMKGSILPGEHGTVILDFGNSLFSDSDDNVAIGIGGSFSFHSRGYSSNFSSNLQANKWLHVAVVLKDSKGSVYVNGLFLSEFENQVYQRPFNVLRKYNYIGKTNMPFHVSPNAIYDEIKIYAGALDSSQIHADFADSSG